MTNEFENKFQQWKLEYPEFKNYCYQLQLQIFAKFHPEEFGLTKETLSYDFVLKNPKIDDIGSETVLPDYDKKILEFTLRKGYGEYYGSKYGWTGPYVGLSRRIIKFALQIDFKFKIIWGNDFRFIERSALEKSLKERWVVGSTINKPTIFAIPLEYTIPLKQSEKPNSNLRITEFC